MATASSQAVATGVENLANRAERQRCGIVLGRNVGGNRRNNVPCVWGNAVVTGGEERECV